MGSGKSSAAAFIKDWLMAEYIDADQICRELLMPRGKGWHALRRALGPLFFNTDQTIKRSLLRNSLFNDKKLRFQINSLLHPLVLQVITERINRKKTRTPFPFTLVEVPLLFEANWQKIFDRLVVIFADHNSCLKRIMRRDGISAMEAEKALASQWPLGEKTIMADHVINNSGCWTETCLQLLHLTRLLRKA